MSAGNDLSRSAGDVPWCYVQEHVGGSSGRSLGRLEEVVFGRPQNICRGCSLVSHIGVYGGVLRKLHGDVFKASYFGVLRALIGDVPWRYIESHMDTSIGRLLVISSGRSFAKWDIHNKKNQ